MPELPPPRTHALSRRAVIGLGVLTGAAAAGCSIESDDSPAATPATATPTVSGGVTPDVRTATAALGAVVAAQAVVGATVQRFPALRPQLAPLVAMHEAHRRSLVDAVPSPGGEASAPSYAVPRGRDRALARLDATEVRLRTTLQGLALRAESGDFARLLASMAAGISVHRDGA